MSKKHLAQLCAFCAFWVLLGNLIGFSLSGCSTEEVAEEPTISVELQEQIAFIDLPDNPPPEITSEEGWILMDQTDVMLAEARASLDEYSSPPGTTELLYMGSRDCVPDDVIMCLVTLAHNDYDDFAQERLERLERYNEDFVEAGGTIPSWVWEDIRLIRWYLPSEPGAPN